MTNRDFKGVWIDRNVWLNKALTLQEKVFLVEIDSLDRNQDGCFAGNTYFADFFGISVSRTSEVINSLIKKEYLVAEYDREGKRIIQRRLYASVFGKGDEGIREIRRTYSGLAIDNNTLNNKVNKLIAENEKLKSQLSDLVDSSNDLDNSTGSAKVDNKCMLWVKENSARLLKLKSPLTNKQTQWFADNYPEDVWQQVFEDMENRATLLKDYVSANLTARKWLRNAKWLPYEKMTEKNAYECRDVMGKNQRAMTIFRNKTGL